MMTPFEFTLAALAVWRLTHAIVLEAGPANLLLRLRQALRRTPLGAMLGCFYCTSVWVAVPFAAWLETGPMRCTMAALALSGASILALQLTDKRIQLMAEDAEPAPEDALPAEALQRSTP